MYQISQSFPPLSPSPSFPPLFLTSRRTLLSEHLEQANREKSLKRERHTRKETGEREGGGKEWESLQQSLIDQIGKHLT